MVARSPFPTRAFVFRNDRSMLHMTPYAVRAALAFMLATLAGCSALDNLASGDKLDYRGASTRTSTLDVPPDLTQLARDGRFTPQASGTVTASTYGTASAAAVTAGTRAVAPTEAGDFKMQRAGNQRWLTANVPADKLWPQLREFWQERGFTVMVDSAEAGVMETEWAENRAKLPDDIIRRTIGRVLDSFYSTGERDKFRTRVERNGNGSEIYVTHFGLTEELVGALKERTVWTTRPNDPQLEAEFLQRLMVKLGAKPDEAKATVAAAGGTPAAAKARTLSDQPTATVQVDDTFDRAWRRVGQALDRNGFTVEDRDRSTGTYFVRYADPRTAALEEPGFFAKLFGGATDQRAPNRYRIQIKGEGERSTVAVLNAQGAPESGDVGQRIAGLLVEELR
jgi:outer membrane protein assembly factor BamC